MEVEAKTRSATLRLDERVLERLQHESESREITLNVFVNQILKQYLDWHLNAPKAKFVPVSRLFVTKLMEKLTEQESKELAEFMAENRVVEAVVGLRSEYSPESALDVFESWLKVSNIPFDHSIRNGAHCYAVQHDMGKNFSIYLSEICRNVFEKLSSKKVEAQITSSSVMVKIRR